MKSKLITLGLMSLMWAGLAFGQSACGQAGIDCSHSTHTGHDSGSSGGGRARNNDNVEPRELSAQESTTWKGVEQEQLWKKTGDRNAYYWAVNFYSQALLADLEYAPAYVGLVDLYEGGIDHKKARQYAELALKAKHDGGKDAPYRMNKATRWWLEIEVQGQFVGELKDWYAANCNLHTSASGSGDVVDPRADVMKQVRQCQDVAGQIAKEQPKAEKMRQKWVNKYHELNVPQFGW